MNNDEILLHLSVIEGVGPNTIQALVERKPWDIELADLYQMSSTDIMKFFSLTSAKAQTLVEGLSNRSLIDHELELIEHYHIKWLTVFSHQYPDALKHIHLPPTIIYIQGNLPVDCSKNLAVIGSRKINYYGLSAIETIVPAMITAGWSIVSGGAIGADTAAHKIAVNAAGRTVSVMGSGLLNPYPASNRRLFAEIVDAQGALVSIFPLTCAALPGNFPARNRIIAGLSAGCLVVQAARKSGTHLTAHYALEAGRQLFAIPGPIDDELCVGCHDLIKQGATLVCSASDILEEFGSQGIGSTNNELDHQQSLLPAQSIEPSAFKAEGPQATILRFCSTPSCTDELAIGTGLGMNELYALLFELELSGYIEQQSNGMWKRR